MKWAPLALVLALTGCVSGNPADDRPSAECGDICSPQPLQDFGFTTSFGPQPNWTWTVGGAELPFGLAEAAFAQEGYGGTLVGGFIAPAGGSPSIINVSSGWNDETTSELPPYPFPVHHAQAAYIGTTLYVFGGYVGGAPNPLAASGVSKAPWPVTALAFRLDGESWAPIASLPEARAAGGAAVVDSAVYLIGGTTDAGHTATVLRYNPSTDDYTEMAPLPTPRDHLNVVSWGAGVIFAVGGRDIVSPAVDDLGTFEAFYPVTNEWHTLPDCPLERGGQVAGILAGRLVVAGGERAEGEFTVYDDVQAYEFANRTWIDLPSMPEARHGGAFVPVYEGLLYVGGAMLDGTLASTSMLLSA